MKRLIILILAITLLPISSSVFATGTTVFNNGPDGTNTPLVSDAQTLSASTDAISTFEFKAGVNTVTQSGKTLIGTAVISNNTRDGYTLTLTPSNGVLKASATTHGESDITYSILFSKASGTLGGNVAIANKVATVVGGTAYPMAQISGTQTSPTVALNIKAEMDISSAADEQILMAGTYTESFTCSYADL